MREIMREITQEEIDKKVEAHQLWRDTNKKQGERAIFTDVLITNKNFYRRNLRQAVFRNVKCVDTNFRNADLTDTLFENVYFDHVNFNGTILECSLFKQCKIINTAYFDANLKNVYFKYTTLIDVDFRSSNLRYTSFSTAKIKNIFVTHTTPMSVFGQRVICTQVNTSRKNNLISYWADLGIWTTGCFQGTLEELRQKVAETHKDNPFLRARYERAINYILEEDRADKEKGKEEK